MRSVLLVLLCGIPVYADEPNWVVVDPLRPIANATSLADLDARMPQGHEYVDNDLVTWGHETSHGISSRLRKVYNQTGDPKRPLRNINVFYVLGGRAVVLREPSVSLHQVARSVPLSLRGVCYQHYLVDCQRAFNEMPTYVLDEWVAYSNGSAVRVDYALAERVGTVDYMMEFSVYAICLAYTLPADADPQIKTFIKWHLQRSLDLLEKNRPLGKVGGADRTLQVLRSSSDAAHLRKFLNEWLGTDWTRVNLGFK